MKKDNPKIWIAAMVFMALMVTVVPLSVSGQVEASGLPFGSQVGEYNGVIAYSNYENDYVSDEYNYVDGYNTGMKWQCVEYVNRYYYIVYGLEIRIPGTNAEDYYDTASDRGLVAYPNGGTTSPQPGDVLCSDGGTLGHVAIIREVTDDGVHVIHQNWANTEADNDKMISMSVSDGHYTISEFSGSYPVQGWLRKPIEVIYVPDGYAKIQWAVDNASDGDTIIVRDDIYIENVDVTKSLTIRSENGSANCIVQAADLWDNVFEVTADYVNVSGFTVTGAGWRGMHLRYADHCNISNNNVSNNDDGIWLRHSSNNVVSNNVFVNDGLYVDDSYQNTVENNTINSKPLVYLEDASDYTITDAGQVILVNCDNITVDSLNLSNAGVGIELWKTNNSKIVNNNINSNNYYSIWLEGSSNNNISNNNVSNNYGGVFVYVASNNNIIINNKVLNNSIFLVCSSNTTLMNNVFVNSGLLIWDSYSYKNTVENNTVNGKPLVYLEDASDYTIADAGQVILVNCKNIMVEGLDLSNTAVGIELLKTTDNCKIANNNVSNNGYGILVDSSSNNTIANNTASNGSSIKLGNSNYNIISNNNILNNNYGISFELDRSNNNTITNNNVSNNLWGICLWRSNNNTLTNNEVSSNKRDGIELDESSNNTLSNNIVSLNNYAGIELDKSNNNRIYLNNFINNTDNVESWDSINIWNSTTKITYTYNGSTYTNYLGNYWSDYTDVDANDDGIWDNPRGIDSDWDYHPLVEHFENYQAPAENVFDTGAPANPYPSIMGNHTGTIKPNHTVIATKLYTYSCIGTGGHTEYAHIWNLTWNATATWEGYAGDWHNITFNKTVVLLANKTYNYTIRTGSYPQIHHTPALPTANGWINCTKFTDANDKEYYDWIPAIRLWS